MIIERCEQLSKEWFDLQCGSIGGTRFGQVISGRDNNLVYDLINEQLDGYVEPDDYVSDDMLFGQENEPIARQLYSEQTGIIFEQVGMIRSERSKIHHASPDGINFDRGIVLEIKSTQNGATQIRRYFNGPESDKIGQIINYFAVSDKINEVRWVSSCPNRPERPLVEWIYTRETLVKSGKKMISIAEIVESALVEIDTIESEVNEMKNKFIF